MKVGPDGSLPRNTSRFKCINTNLKLAKVPEQEIGTSDKVIRLIWTGEKEKEITENSDNEMWSDEYIPNTNQSVKEKCVGNIKSNKSIEESKSETDFARSHKNSSRYYNSSRHNRSYRGNRNLNSKNKNFNPRKRNFRRSGNYGRSYQPQQNSNDLNPWAVPPPIPGASNFQYPSYLYSPLLNGMILTPSNSVVDNAAIKNPKRTLLSTPPYTSPCNFSHRSDFLINMPQHEEFSQDDGHPSRPVNYEPGKSNEDGFPIRPVNYEGSNSNDNFNSTRDYKVNKTNDEFISRPPNYEESNKNNEYASSSSYPPNNYNAYFHSYDINCERSQHPGNSARGRCNSNQQWGNTKKQNYKKWKRPYRGWNNERRNANGHFDYRN